MIGAVLGIVAVQPGCSLLVDSDTAQCNADTDCQSRGAEFAGTYCGPRKVCIPVAGFCQRNQECIDRTGNDATICRKSDNTCVTITSRECSTVYREVDDLRNDNAIIIGVHGIPSWAPIPNSAESGVELGRRDLVATLGGLPASQSSNGQSRPVVLLACDVPFGEQELHRTVTDHLIDTVQVPAIIGPYAFPDWLAYAVTRAVPRQTMLISADQVYPGFEAPGSEGLKFFTGPPNASLTRVQANAVPLVEAKIKAEGKTTPLKLAFLSPGTGVSTQDAVVFEQAVRFNGQPALANGANYKEFIYGDPNSPNISVAIADAIVQLRAFEPDIVVITGGLEAEVVPVELEKTLTNIHYIIRTEAAQSRIVTNFQQPEQRRKRMFGVRLGAPAGSPAVQRFQQRYTQVFEGEVGSIAGVHFDAFYLLAYALGSIKDKPVITGRDIGAVLLQQLQGTGTAVDASPNSFLQAIGTLEQKRPLAFTGVEGLYTFDASGQHREWKITLFCIDPNSTASNRLQDSGIYYDGLTEAFVGTNTCF